MILFCEKRHLGSPRSSALSFLLVLVQVAFASGFFVLPSSQSLQHKTSPLYSSPNYINGDSTIHIGGSYIRWRTRQSSDSPDSAGIWELQTAVTTFLRTNPKTKQREQIELHAQVHYGDKDYFDFYNSDEFTNQQDEVLYELLVDEELLGLSSDKAGRALKKCLQASPNDQSIANGYGWRCQVDLVDYTHPKFKHADFTRQELLQQQQQQQQQKQHIPKNNDRPLWQQVGTNADTAFWQPAVSALLVGPPSLFVSTTDASDSSFGTRRKLFTNLFLPGNQLAGWLRAMLWMTVPAPEVSVLLLDWSSLFLSKSSARFSPVTIAVLQSLMTLQLGQLRKLVFGQVLVAGNSAQQQPPQQNQDWQLLVTERNDHALQVLQSSLQQQQTNNKNDSKRMALLYGCSHCPDLHAKLARDFGFTAVKTEWRTAWSVSVPKTFGANAIDSPREGRPSQMSKQAPPLLADLYGYLPPTAWAALFLLFPLYLSVGAVDWIDTIHSSSIYMDKNDVLSFSTDWLLYLLRHVLLYVGISKFALEWQDSSSNSSG